MGRRGAAPAARSPGAARFRISARRLAGHACATGPSPIPAPGRLLPWLPVAFGLGIAIYFAAEREPALVGRGFAACWFALCSRSSPAAGRSAFPLALAAQPSPRALPSRRSKTVQVAHPVLARPAGNVTIAGFVEVREERERTDRIVVRALSLEGARLEQKPERVRVSVQQGHGAAGRRLCRRSARGSIRRSSRCVPAATTSPAISISRASARPASRSARSSIAEPPAQPGLWLRYAATVQGMRDAIDARIRAALPGDKGAIASALITGKRDAISAPVNDAMYISSLAHVLSISGYHMALVAGVVFFVLRALLALVAVARERPADQEMGRGAARWSRPPPISMLSGAEVATQRAFIMTAIVLIGVMADRRGADAAHARDRRLAVLLFAPQSVVHPSFQMSFAATLALIAAYERGLPWMAKADTSLSAPRRAVGRPRDRGAGAGLAGRGARDHALRRLPFPPPRALRRDRQSASPCRSSRSG